MLLEVKDINTFYGISHILFDVSLSIDEGEVVCLLGRNGVGKTTTMKSIMGLVPPNSGSIKFQGTEISKKKAYEIARLGIGYVPEDRIIFPSLSVKENLEMGIIKGHSGAWNMDRVCSIFPKLKERQNQKGGTLSGGEQQMLTIARALMGNPSLLLLEEPSEGLAPIVVEQLKGHLKQLREEGMPIIISEQNSGFVLNLSDRAYILEKGHIRWNGDVTDLKRNPEIMMKFLGV